MWAQSNVRNLVDVRGATTCPRAEEVAASLAGMLPAEDGAGVPVADVALLKEDGDLIVELRRASGELIGEKRIARTLTCGARAETAAVFVAAWEARLGGERMRPLAVPEPVRQLAAVPTRVPVPTTASPALAAAGAPTAPASTSARRPTF